MEQLKDNVINGGFARRRDSLKHFIEIAFKHQRLIATAFLAVVVIVTLVTFLLTPVFRATATMLLERESHIDKALLFRMNFPSQFEKYDWLKSELEILNSYPVAARVVKEQGLAEVNAEDESTLSEKDRRKFKKAVEKFQKRLSIEIARNSNVISVGYEDKNPGFAAATANKVIDTYLTYRSEIYDESDTYQFFEEQMRIADEKLRQLEQSQAEFKHRENLISPKTQLEILLSKLADFEKTLTSVRTKRIGKEAKLKVVTEQLDLAAKDVSIPSTEVSDSPSREKYIAKLKGELLDMEIRRDRLAQRFKPTYQEIVDLEKNITATKNKIKSEISQIIREEETAIKALRAEENALQKSIDTINQEVGEFAQKEYEMAQISRGIDDKREVYSMLLKQREEARLSLAKLERGVKIKIISPAVVPSKPDRPRKVLNLSLGMILGLMTGFGLAFLVELSDRSVSTPQELEEVTGVPALGSVREL
ncbi:MAG: GumC family protein [bacterium]